MSIVVSAGGSLLTNIRLAKTANYTVVNGDKGKTIALGGSAYFTLTISAASGYDSDFAILVVNEDTARAKLISPNGLTSFYLWPLQTALIYNQNSVWYVDKPNRWQITGTVNLNIDPTNGSDTTSADGLSTGAAAFATAAHAYAVAEQYFDFSNGGAVNAVYGSGTITFTASQAINGGPLVGGSPGSFTFKGAGSASTTLNSSTASVYIFYVTNGAQFTVSAMTITSSGTGGGGVVVGGGWVNLGSDVKFNNCTGFCMDANGASSTISTNGQNYTVAGTNGYLAIAEDQATIYLGGGTLTLSATPTFSNAFVQADLGGFIEFTPAPTISGTATAKKYNVTQNGFINSNGLTFPGGTAGTQGSGGILDNGLKAPTYQVLTSGTAATYTTPSGATRLEVRMVGPGGSSAGAGGAGKTNGSAGTNTVFNSINAAAGSPGVTTGATAPGGTGGSGTADLRIPGGDGAGGAGFTNASSGPGGGSTLGCGAPGVQGAAATGGTAATSNTGGGASGATGTATLFASGSGGGGEYVEYNISAPAATYTYTVGTAGTAGSAGASGGAGALGGSGLIIVKEIY